MISCFYVLRADVRTMKQAHSRTNRQKACGYLFAINKKLGRIERLVVGDLTGSQLLLLPIIASFPSAPNLREVSEKNGTSHQNTRVLLSKLEEKQYISLVADKFDYRILRVALTRKGSQAVEDCCERLSISIDELYRGISEEEIAVTVKVLAVIHERLGDFRFGD